MSDVTDLTDGSGSSSSSSSSNDPSKFIYIIAAVGCVIFTFIYRTLWKRGQENNEAATARARPQTEPPEEDDDDDSNDSLNDEQQQPDEEEAEQQPPERPRRRQKITHPYEPKERQPGDPIYNKYIIYGTLANAILLWIGAIVVLGIALKQQSEWNDADLDDFSPLDNGCRILNATTYEFRTNRIDARNDLCVETWEYTVELTDNDDELVFVHAPMSSETCRASCEACADRLYGPMYYVGLGGPKRNGKSIDNETDVDCYEPNVPIQELSDYYNCGRQRSDEPPSCFLLKDPSIKLKDDQTSTQMSLIISYVCFGVGFLLMLVVYFFISSNRREAERGKQLQELKQAQTPVPEPKQDENSAPDTTTTNSNTADGKDAAIEDGAGAVEDDNDDKAGQQESTTTEATADKLVVEEEG